MLEIKDIEKLGKLARIELTQGEMEKLLKEVDPILGYITQLKEVVGTIGLPAQAGEEKVAGEHRNIDRVDGTPTETGTNTKAIVADMPDSQDNYLKVKKIL